MRLSRSPRLPFCFLVFFLISPRGGWGVPWPGQGPVFRVHGAPASKRVQKSIFFHKKRVHTSRYQNVSFQMCPESSLDHFGQGKTLPNQKNVFLRNPGKIRKSKTKHMGVGQFPIEPLTYQHICLDPLFCPWGPRL